MARKKTSPILLFMAAIAVASCLVAAFLAVKGGH